MKKPTEKQIKRYFRALDLIEDAHWGRVYALEKIMKKETGIKDIEFFCNENEIVGIGSASRKMKLIHRE